MTDVKISNRGIAVFSVLFGAVDSLKHCGKHLATAI